MVISITDIEDFRVHRLPHSVYYVPDFVSAEEEAYCLDRISRTPKTKWTQLRNRRLQNWGGVPHPKGMIPEAMPDWLSSYVDKVNDLGVFGDVKANHVLLNEYRPGQGISPHLDGDLFYPTIATISLGSHTVLNFYRPFNDSATPLEGRLAYSLLIKPRSLILIKDQMYTDFLHGIEEQPCDVLSPVVLLPDECDASASSAAHKTLERGTRISLTIRHVPKTLKRFRLQW